MDVPPITVGRGGWGKGLQNDSYVIPGVTGERGNPTRHAALLVSRIGPIGPSTQ